MRKLELEAQSELHAARQMRPAGMQEVGRTIHTAVHTVVLGVVKEIVVLPAEVNGVVFGPGEALGQAEVKVHAARVGQCAPANVTEGQADGDRESIRVVKQGPADPRDV